MYYSGPQIVDHYNLCAKVKMIECKDDIIQPSLRISKLLVNNIRSHYDFWNSFDKINIYYDNGQVELTKIIMALFTSLFSNVEIRRVKPGDYKLFQVADLICTMELLSEKTSRGNFTSSEMEFFYSVREF